MPKVSDDYKEKKRESLLESALICFGEKGYHSTTMDDIVAYSKTSKGLIYNYFKSKEELYLTLMQEKTVQTFEKINARFQKLNSAKDKLKELFQMYSEISLTEEWRNMIRVHMEFWINSARHENLQKIMIDRYKDQYRIFLSEIIEQGKIAGEFKDTIDPVTISSLFWAYIDGICLHYSVVEDDDIYKEQFKATEEMIMNYILINK
ncbi:TetR/AcrR family transcriptional regulator [Gottfriedia luciferensis]|uniref:TetR/AcrR family transcriptional regulator n=1 Tax=Gottfriedia luciferensis TaxID=178774 RepID=UPI00130264B7|nr:TetR/AcrR family transcriptional regulator [Gottfriedia luciferensis]